MLKVLRKTTRTFLIRDRKLTVLGLEPIIRIKITDPLVFSKLDRIHKLA